MMPLNPHQPTSGSAADSLTSANLAAGGVGSRFPTWLVALLLMGGSMALYWPATHHDFINFDDDLYVTSNLHVQNGLSWEGIQWAFRHAVADNWHPLTMLSHMLDCELFGLQPGGHHLTSLLVHAVNTVLVFLLFRRLTGAVWPSALVAALFGWHPVHVQSVAWVAERKDVLSTAFGLTAMLFYERHARVSGPQRSVFYLASLLAFALGLLCKPMLVTWPFLLLLLDYWPLDRFKPGRWGPLVREKLPYFALAAAVSVVTFVVQKQEGAMMAMANMSLAARGANALISYGRYLGKMFWPTDLAIFYPLPRSWPWELVLLAGLFLSGVTVLLVLQRRRYPFLLMGWLWFVITLVPVIGLVQVGEQSMADRYLYIPSLGVLVMVVWGVGELARGWRWQYLAVAWSVVLILCLVLTRQQLGYWRNGETLFRRALSVTEPNDTVLNGLGFALLKQGNADEAVSQFRTVLRLKPDSVTAHNNLGDALSRQGQSDEAVAQFLEALRLQSDYEPAHNNLGTALFRQGQTDAAISQFQEALRLDPEDAEVHYNLGNALVRQRRTDAAVAQFLEAIRLNQSYAPAYNNLGNVLAGQGQTDAAISRFQTALRLNPDYADAHYNLGNSLLKQGRFDEASNQFQAAIRLASNHAPAHYNLGVALNKLGRPDEAISQFQQALRLQPDYAIAHNSLGIALGGKGRLDEAIREFQEAVRLQPNYAAAQTNLATALELKSKPHGPSPGP